MMPQSEYIAEDIVLLAIQNQLGNLLLAAAELGLTRSQLVAYLTRHPELLERAKSIRIACSELVKDEAEDLLTAGMRGDNTLLMFYLKTQAKERGYDTAKGSTNTTNVEVNVDARSLIAAMRSGAKLIDEKPVEEESELFDISYILTDNE
jgi:hypothetical protein